jgi:hypothetical protein
MRFEMAGSAAHDLIDWLNALPYLLLTIKFGGGRANI